MSLGVRRSWTSQEDEQLRLLVSYWGDQCGKNGNWDKISSNFQHRSAKDCRKRWFHSLDPKLKRGRWSEAEDKTLLDAYKRIGPSWQRVAQLIPGRTDDQCAKRYNDVLAPGASDRLREWTPEEDALLLELIEQHGTRWRDICKQFDGRTGLTCRNRWRKLKTRAEVDGGNPSSQETSPLNAPLERGQIEPQIGQDPQEFPDPPFSAGSTSYSISYEPTASYQQQQASSTQYPLAEAELQRILEFCRQNDQKIVIHQHIYSVTPQQVVQGVPQGVSQAQGMPMSAPPLSSAPPMPSPMPSAPIALSSAMPQQTPNLPPQNTQQRFLDTPQPEDMFMGLGNFAGMDYLAFNPS